MSTLPRLNDPVVMRDTEGRSYASRVEDIAPDLLTLARPLDLSAADPFEVGAELLVTWTCPSGVGVLPVRLARAGEQGRVRLWDVEVLADAWYEQRRAYVRVLASGPVALQVVDDDAEAAPIPGYLVDVGEGGLRCSVEVAAGGDRLADGAQVRSRFRLRNADFDLPGRIRPGRQPRSSGGSELIVVFDQPVEQADALRRQVFVQQIHSRRG